MKIENQEENGTGSEYIFKYFVMKISFELSIKIATTPLSVLFIVDELIHYSNIKIAAK